MPAAFPAAPIRRRLAPAGAPSRECEIAPRIPGGRSFREMSSATKKVPMMAAVPTVFRAMVAENQLLGS